MSTYRMSDNTVVKTENATQSWTEDTYWDGHNHISKATGSQLEHQRLYRSRKGRYYLESWSAWQGTHARAEWVSNEEAARWLVLMGEELPAELRKLEAEFTE